MQIDLASVVASDLPRLSKPQQSEIELVRAIAQGDKRATHVLFAKHRLGVYRFALRLVDEKEAESQLGCWRSRAIWPSRCCAGIQWRNWMSARPPQFRIMLMIPRQQFKRSSKAQFSLIA